MKKSLFILSLVCFFIACEKEQTKEISCESISNESARTIVHDNLTREYLLYLPSGYDGSIAMPLLLNFHGFGGTASDFINIADMRSFADSEGFIAVYPQGACLNGSSHWNAALPGGDNKSDVDDLGFVEVLIDQLSAEYNIDSDRIYACGYSNGAFFSYALACYRSDLIAAIGSISGALLDSGSTCALAHPTAMINFHGTDDEVIPYEGSNAYIGTQDAVAWWAAQNHTIDTPVVSSYTDDGLTVEHYAYFEGDSGVAVEHYKIINGGHVWFDFNHQGSCLEELLWSFLSQYDRNGLR